MKEVAQMIFWGALLLMLIVGGISSCGMSDTEKVNQYNQTWGR